MPERLVVIGGDAAGMTAASQARRLRGAQDLQIVAVERGSFTSYSACGIPYWIGGVVTGPDALVARTPEVFERDYAITVRLGTEATVIDLDRREVLVRATADGAEDRLGFDSLVIATGASPVRLRVPGAEVTGISSTPATGLRKVRTIGTNLANTTAFAGPNRSK